MQRFRQAAIISLILFLFIGSMVIIYYLLMWQVAPKGLAIVLLFALMLFKYIISGIKNHQNPSSFSRRNKQLLKFILLSLCYVFLVTVYISYLLKNQQPAAWVSFVLCLLTLKKALHFLPAY